MSHTLSYMVRGGPPKSPPNPAFPQGVDVDLSDNAKVSCLVVLPYPNPNKNIGTWMIRCDQCKQIVAVTAAARSDDPRTVRLACKEKTGPLSPYHRDATGEDC